MLFLIDGYNLMHAKGLMRPGMTPSAFHHSRLRFLDAVEKGLGPDRAARTTIVFDAFDPPLLAPRELAYKGMTILFAVGDENADARLEALIACHPNPRRLTVISSDRRVREAAARRRAHTLDADSFWSGALAQKPRSRPQSHVALESADRPAYLGDHEEWLSLFAHVDQALQTTAEAPGLNRDFAPTDAELEQVAREVEREEGPC
jgi:hypothetical protein